MVLLAKRFDAGVRFASQQDGRRRHQREQREADEQTIGFHGPFVATLVACRQTDKIICARGSTAWRLVLHQATVALARGRNPSSV